MHGACYDNFSCWIHETQNPLKQNVPSAGSRLKISQMFKHMYAPTTRALKGSSAQTRQNTTAAGTGMGTSWRLERGGRATGEPADNGHQRIFKWKGKGSKDQRLRGRIELMRAPKAPMALGLIGLIKLLGLIGLRGSEAHRAHTAHMLIGLIKGS